MIPLLGEERTVKILIIPDILMEKHSNKINVVG